MEKNYLIETLRKYFDRDASGYGLELVYLYGSRAAINAPRAFRTSESASCRMASAFASASFSADCMPSAAPRRASRFAAATLPR